MILVSDLVLVCNMLKKQEDEQKCQVLTLSKNVAPKNTPVSAFWKIWIIMHCSVATDEIHLRPPFTRPLTSPIPALVNGQNLSMPVRNLVAAGCQILVNACQHPCQWLQPLWEVKQILPLQLLRSTIPALLRLLRLLRLLGITAGYCGYWVVRQDTAYWLPDG